MFRPFLPCGIAYGSAYGIPCSFSGGRHPAGLFVLYHIGAVLVNRFRQNFGGICLFPAPGVPPCRGGIAPALQARRALAVPCGGVPSLLPTLPLAYFIAPYPPDPLPAGKGGWGDGGRIKAKGRGGRRQARQATPADSGTARSADDQPGKSPHHPRAAYTSSREAAVWAESRRKEG